MFRIVAVQPHPEFISPPNEFRLVPFWFWNDDLDERELERQIDDFQAHGCGGFVIHPRVGLPRSIGWMSERMLHFVRFAVEAAAKRRMRVVLYDEGMYPSGSSSGQVVAANPAHQCRGMALVEGEPSGLGGDAIVIGRFAHGGRDYTVVNRPIDSVIRGLHYVGEGPAEETPPATDILNPDAVASFIRLVYDRYFEAVGDHFGTTITGIFTDEPSMLGRPRERGQKLVPGTRDTLAHFERLAGYDLTPHLAALWFKDAPDAARHRRAYDRALSQRLEETFYAPLSSWCEEHGVALMGHPHEPDDIAIERYFHVPGQDLVWRWVLPGPTAVEGPQSTQGKCSSSAMIHLGRRRNSNEFCGAYGHELTYEQMKWLADWCFVRGVNDLIPHAFYYSVRGPRRDERPPDVGPNSAWWGRFRPFADHCARLSWLNTDCTHVCDIAILGDVDELGWQAAKACFESGRDFNYLDVHTLVHESRVDAGGIRVAGMHYRVLIVEDESLLTPEVQRALRAMDATRVVRYRDEASLVAALDEMAPPRLTLEPGHRDLRLRQVVKQGRNYLIVFNEGSQRVEARVRFTQTPHNLHRLDTHTAEASPVPDAALALGPFEFVVLSWEA